VSIVRRARPEIQALLAYEAAAQVDETVRLNANESPQTSTIGGFRRPLNRYPEIRPQRLQAALAARYGCDSEQLLVTRGSSEAIDLLIRAFCRAGLDNIVTATPSFSMYRHYAEIQAAAVVEVTTHADQDFAVDVNALLEARTEMTRLVFICTPNNPTGTSLPRADLLRLLDGCSNRAAVVVDEAYIEFSQEKSAIELLDHYPNLVVLRTLSKALGFAGARCGAIAASSDVIRMLSTVQAPYALATPVVECVENVLQSQQLAAAGAVVAQIVDERERLVAELGGYDFVLRVWPSDANFFLVRVHDVAAVMRCCAAHNILLRQFGGDLSDCLRITVGSRSDNKLLLRALDTLRESQDAR